MGCHSQFVFETIEPTAPTITDPMTSLTAKNPEMFIQILAGTSCAQTFTEATQNGIKEKAKYRMTASVCRASTFTGDEAVGGNKDACWIEGAEVGKYDHAKQTFVQQGEIVAAVGPVRQLCLGSGVLQLQVTTTRVKKSG